MKPFVDFYAANKIAPVHQDISDLGQHFERREALYRHLGIPAGLMRGKSVIEFGPGTGQNAIYTASLDPSRYVLVDGNPTGLQETSETLTRYCPDYGFEIRESLIEAFETEERFDLVLCEGVIPFQVNPAAFARHVAQFVAPGGLLVITCIDGVSFLGESTRRLIADSLIDFGAPAEARLAALRPVFAPHLATLKGMSRLIDDWLYDNILVPYSGSLFSIPDAIGALDADFDVYGSSPSFLSDWRWYKQLTGDERRYNARAIALYHQHLLNLIDYRATPAAHAAELGEKVLYRATALFEQMNAMETANDLSGMPQAAAKVGDIAELVADYSPATAQSLLEVAKFLKQPNAAPDFESFISFFGRGQQYVSFTRRA